MNILKGIVSECADVDPSQIDENMSLQGNIGIDSFGLVSMLMDIEEEFNVKISERELKHFQTLNDIYSYICAN